MVETYSVLLARARDGRRAAIAFLDAVDAFSGARTVERIVSEKAERAKAIFDVFRGQAREAPSRLPPACEPQSAVKVCKTVAWAS